MHIKPCDETALGDMEITLYVVKLTLLVVGVTCTGWSKRVINVVNEIHTVRNLRDGGVGFR